MIYDFGDSSKLVCIWASSDQHDSADLDKFPCRGLNINLLRHGEGVLQADRTD